ncbi:MAG: hypothetical protein ACHQ50_15335 [Fimbriimonadales bacterium]
MDPRNFIRSASILAVLAAAISFVAGSSRQKDRLPTGQGRIAGLEIKRAPRVARLSMARKSRILSSKRVSLDTSSPPLSYSPLHAYDSNGSLLFIHPNMINFKGGEALIDGSSGTSLVSVQFNPIAVNQMHLVIFTIEVGSETVDVVAQAGGGPAETVTCKNGTSYIPVLIQPTSTRQASVDLSITAGNFWFDNVTVELVK